MKLDVKTIAGTIAAIGAAVGSVVGVAKNLGGDDSRSGLGEDCTRTADCVEGARCVDGRCSDGSGAAVALIVTEASSHQPAQPATPSATVTANVVTTSAPVPVPEAGRSPGGATTAICPRYAGVVGKWRATTLVTSADSARAVGVNGYYEMNLRATADCRLEAEVMKTGYESKELLPDAVQVGTTVLDAFDEDCFNEGFHRGSVTLTSRRGVSLDLILFLRFEGSRMSGVWHYAADDWSKHRMTGAIVGEKGLGEKVPLVGRKQLPKVEECILTHCAVEDPGADWTCSAGTACADCRGSAGGAPR